MLERTWITIPVSSQPSLATRRISSNARFLTGLGLGGGIPLTIALASDFAPLMAQGRLVILMTAGVAIGFTVGGWLASQVVRFLGWPGIFAMGGVLPLAIVPLLVLRLPESVALRAATRPQNPVTALFRDGLAASTALLWPMNLLNLLSNFFILLWMPAILHGIGVSLSPFLIDEQPLRERVAPTVWVRRFRLRFACTVRVSVWVQRQAFRSTSLIVGVINSSSPIADPAAPALDR